jgi:anti-sigma factor RsiW
MNKENCLVSQEEMQAFVDGELDLGRAAEFARLVADDPALSGKVDLLRRDKERLEQIYGPLRALPLPEKWLHLINSWSPPQKRSFSGLYYYRPAVLAVAASFLVVMGVWLGYHRVWIGSHDAIVAEALDARADSTKPAASFAAESAPPERRNEVLSTSLAMPLKAPDLSKLGYSLADIRVYADVPGGKAVELAYRNAQNTLFTLYLRHPTGPPRVDLTENKGLRICVWQDEVLGTVMLGEMSAGEMARIASLAYSGLTL